MIDLRAGSSFLRSELLAAYGATAIFSLRHGGVSHPPFSSLNLGSGLGDDEENITRNMEMLIYKAGLPGMPHRAKQVHGTNILVCQGPGIQHQEQADILIGMSGASVAVCIADCVPVLLVAPAAGIIAAVHAGWRGTAARVVTHAIAVMQRHGAKPKKILASIGPCIGPCCFEINDSTANDLCQCCNDGHQFIHDVNNRAHANLAGINAQQLRCSGIPRAHIEQITACTCCDEKHFYSWRRDGERAGRHLAVVALPDAS